MEDLSCLDAPCSTSSLKTLGLLNLWFYHWYFESFPDAIFTTLWRWCMSCQAVRNAEAAQKCWRTEKFSSPFLFGRIRRKFPYTHLTRNLYLIHWGGLCFWFIANLGMDQLRRLNSSSNFFSFQASAAETKVAIRISEDIEFISHIVS